MMYMWMWFGYDLGEFMFPGLDITSRWSFALTWIVLFFTALMFEASKVYLARVQRDAQSKLYPNRCDERRNLLSSDREQGMEPTTSRNASTGQVSRWASLKVRVLVNLHQSMVFVVHNVVGYLLMLAVMVYNVHLLLAVVFGMMLGYFLFGPKLTRIQMQCFSNRPVICTPECDDTAETTPPLLESGSTSETDIFICRTRTCIQPSHYFVANANDGNSELTSATCYYGAKRCPSMVAKAKKLQAHCSHSHNSNNENSNTESEKEDSPSVEDVQLLRTQRQGCCKKKEPPPEKKCCKTQEDVEETKCCEEEEEKQNSQREESPQISCCHSAKAPSESQEQIM